MSSKLTSTRGMTLVEVMIATVMMSIVMAALMSYIIIANKTRVHADARRTAAHFAHDRCIQFANGGLHPDIAATYHSTATLPGGIPATLIEDVVTIAANGDATLVTTVTIETARAIDTAAGQKESTVSAGTVRFSVK